MLCSKVRQLNPFLTHSDTYADCTGTRSFCMCWGFDHVSRLAFLGFAKCFETHAASPPSELVEADHGWSMWLTSTSEQSLVAATWWWLELLELQYPAVKNAADLTCTLHLGSWNLCRGFWKLRNYKVISAQLWNIFQHMLWLFLIDLVVCWNLPGGSNVTWALKVAASRGLMMQVVL